MVERVWGKEQAKGQEQRRGILLACSGRWASEGVVFRHACYVSGWNGVWLCALQIDIPL